MLGLFKLLFISNAILGPWLLYYKGVYGSEKSFSPGFYWVFAFGSMVNIYCNFSGYIDVAVGSLKLLNIKTSENFNYPFLSRSVQEFWRRWHITLGNAFREIFFYPVTYLFRGNHYLALLVTFVLIGLWHGLSVQWLLFGLWQWLGIVVGIYISRIMKRRRIRERFKINWLFNVLGWAATMLWVAFICAVAFAPDVHGMFSFARHLFNI